MRLQTKSKANNYPALWLVFQMASVINTCVTKCIIVGEAIKQKQKENCCVFFLLDYFYELFY